ncbi:hypothetical protein [Streptomyces sp. NPDC048442]|uniref:hypothetical protein n=1 Tax=Streptomyces sp. NPDC048442 TaxID=3154823 RepID=UPI0034183E32
MASTDADKKRAATYMDEHLLPDAQSAGRMAVGGGQVRPPLLGPPAPSPYLMKQDTGLEGLSAWGTGSGLSDALTAWQGSVNRLMGVLGRERQALQATRGIYQGMESGVTSQLNSVHVPAPIPPSSFHKM